MSSYKLTIQADHDIEDIWEYSNSKWGDDQAVKYLSQLEESFTGLATNPDMGKQKLELRGSPLSYHFGRHVIFYRKGKQV